MNSKPMLAVRSAMLARSQLRARPRYATRARGFTLIEIVMALAILSIGLGLMMQIATGAMRNARQAAQRTEAALYAKSLLDSAGIGERLEEGESSGDFGDDYRWTLSVTKHEIEQEGPNPIDPSMSPVQLYRLELQVEWGERPRLQAARFVTLRALTPDPNG
jgi:general secretion pathway protein I